jgi:hypothetical protein
MAKKNGELKNLTPEQLEASSRITKSSLPLESKSAAERKKEAKTYAGILKSGTK